MSSTEDTPVNDTAILGKGILLRKPFKLSQHITSLDIFEDYIIHTKEFTILLIEYKIWIYPDEVSKGTQIFQLYSLDEKKEEFLKKFEMDLSKELQDINLSMFNHSEYPNKRNIEVLIPKTKGEWERLIEVMREEGVCGEFFIAYNSAE